MLHKVSRQLMIPTLKRSSSKGRTSGVRVILDSFLNLDGERGLKLPLLSAIVFALNGHILISERRVTLNRCG